MFNIILNRCGRVGVKCSAAAFPISCSLAGCQSGGNIAQNVKASAAGALIHSPPGAESNNMEMTVWHNAEQSSPTEPRLN